MSKVFGLFSICCLTLSIAGCGGSDQPTNVAADAGAQAIADYDALMAADEKALDMDPDTSSDE